MVFSPFSRRMPAELAAAWDAFQRQADRVERARQVVLNCLPVGRVDPAPVPVGLGVLHDELEAVRQELGAWRVEQIEPHWLRCRAALDESTASIPQARDVAASTGELEELLDVVTGAVEPLDAWGEAERAWLRLRVRG